MNRLSKLYRSLAAQPGYTLMRGAARFSAIRSAVAVSRGLLHSGRVAAELAALETRLHETQFHGVDLQRFVDDLDREGIAYGLRLPDNTVRGIVAWADTQPCFADRSETRGFFARDRPRAEAALGKPILLAQYFNAAEDCAAVARLIDDPVLRWVATRYLRSVPTFVGANLWWTFPVRALESDRAEHAHLFHRDVDDFRFFKFFFYLTDVPQGEGAHVCVASSHRSPPSSGGLDRWNVRRYSDAEIAGKYAPNQIHEICGPAGTGFAENTLCVHKGSTPKTTARLLLQLQFALFDYGAMHDRRDRSSLKLIA